VSVYFRFKSELKSQNESFHGQKTKFSHYIPDSGTKMETFPTSKKILFDKFLISTFFNLYYWSKSNS
jgi:hypothetical protein